MASILVSIFSSQSMKQNGHGASIEIPRNMCLKSSENTEVIIVGSGITSSALAYTLGKDGRRVHLIIEKDLSQPDRSEEKQLQPRAYVKLIELGLEDCVTRRSFHYGSFITKIREKASSLPNVRLEHCSVTSLVEEKGIVKGVQYKNKSGKDLIASAPLTIVCDGCSLKRLPNATIGAVFVDDTSNTRYPLTGGEIASALSDVILLRDLLRPMHNLNDVSSVYKCLQSFCPLRKPCCNRLSLGGGEFSNAAVALIPGLNPWQLILLLQFSAMPIMWCWTLVTSISSTLSAFRSMPL